jgi:hypothetical protein
MKGFLIVPVNIPPELEEKYKRLDVELRTAGVDLSDPDTGHVVAIFDDTFEPLINAFGEGKVKVSEVVAKVVEYKERLRIIESLYKYALDRYKVDLSEPPHANVFKHNREGISADLVGMQRLGKTYEEMFRYFVRQSAKYIIHTNQKPN